MNYCYTRKGNDQPFTSLGCLRSWSLTTEVLPISRSLSIIQDGTSHPQNSAQQITWFLGPPNVLCPVPCWVGAWVVLSLASGTIFFTAVHVNHDLMIRLLHIGEVQLVTQNHSVKP